MEYFSILLIIEGGKEHAVAKKEKEKRRLQRAYTMPRKNMNLPYSKHILGINVQGEDVPEEDVLGGKCAGRKLCQEESVPGGKCAGRKMCREENVPGRKCAGRKMCREVNVPNIC